MDIFTLIRRFLISLSKEWLGYIFQATGVVTALVFSPYLQYGADVRLDAQYFIIIYFATVLTVRLLYPDSRRTLWYAQQFFRFIRWFLAILAAIFAPIVVGFFQFLAIPGLVSKLAIAFIVLLLLLFTGTILGISDIFKELEDGMVQRFQKRYATPDYEAILAGEEFEHHPKPPLTRLERLKGWLNEERRRFRQFLHKMRDP